MFSETTPLRGIVKIKVKNILTGESYLHTHKRNYITLAALQSIPQLLSLVEWFTTPTVPNTKLLRIHSIRFGTGTIASSGLTSNLEIPVYGAVLGVDNFTLNSRTLVITRQLDETEANGESLTEVALFQKGAYTNDNPAVTVGGGELATPTSILFSRLVHDAIPKDNTLQVTYEWSITSASDDIS